jgi:adenylate kinase family enzyme
LQKVLVIGVSGAGKSTLAQQLAERTRLPYIATDPFYWEAGWQCVSPARVRQRVETATLGEAWVLDGNFDDQRTIIWQRADTIIWLDLALALVVWQVCRRNSRWLITQEPTWSGNIMTVAQAWSGVRHCLRSYHQKRRHYPHYLAAFPHLRVVQLRSRQAIASWLSSVECDPVVPYCRQRVPS